MPRFIRVIDLETTGSRPPAHTVCEIGWQDVVETADGSWEIGGENGQILTDPERSIPPVTQAVHHITDEDVKGCPPFRKVAKAVLQPGGDCIGLAAHRVTFESRFCTPELTGGLPWICTWKSALRVFPDSPSFSNQVLKYWRQPEGLDRERALPVHRAFPDAYTTAFHLRDMLRIEGPDTLIDWNDEPGLLPRVRYGEHRGRKWRELDEAVLIQFLKGRDEDHRFSAGKEMERRTGLPMKEPQTAQPQLF